MSKEIVITVIILIGIIGLNIWVGKYVDSKLNHVLDELSELRPLIEDEKYGEANEKIEKIDEYWQKYENLLSFLLSMMSLKR